MVEAVTNRESPVDIVRFHEDFDRHEAEMIPITTRLPSAVHLKLKALALTSSLQILVEHAYTCYMGSRIEPSLLGGYTWPEPSPRGAVGITPCEGGILRRPGGFLRRLDHFTSEERTNPGRTISNSPAISVGAAPRSGR
jgi:hypothetical protein